MIGQTVSTFAGPPVRDAFEASHHFLPEELTARLPGLLPGVEVDLSDRQEADEDGDRYVAVSE